MPTLLLHFGPSQSRGGQKCGEKEVLRFLSKQHGVGRARWYCETYLAVSFVADDLFSLSKAKREREPFLVGKNPFF
jgi:hypothetical protein